MNTTHAQIARRLNRRAFLKSMTATLGLGGAWVATGCGYYEAIEGEAYEPWSALETETRPVYLAASAALLAANPHNTQPWLFELGERELNIFADKKKSLRSMDSLHREMFLGLGCAIENAVVAAKASGYRVSVTLMPKGEDSDHVATLTLSEGGGREDVALFKAIPNRHTNRGGYLDAKIPGLKDALRAQMKGTEEVSLTVHEEGAAKRTFIQGTVRATEVLIADKEMLHDSDRWFRFSKEDLEKHRDGVTLDATGKGSTTRALGKVFETDSETNAQYWLDSTKAEHATGSAFCVLATQNRNSRVEQLQCGMAYQRLHLWLTSQNLAAHPLNQMPERQDREETLGLPDDFGAVLASLTQPEGWGAQMLFRIGVANKDAMPSPRQPLAWVKR